MKSLLFSQMYILLHFRTLTGIEARERANLNQMRLKVHYILDSLLPHCVKIKNRRERKINIVDQGRLIHNASLPDNNISILSINILSAAGTPSPEEGKIQSRLFVLDCRLFKHFCYALSKEELTTPLCYVPEVERIN